MSLFCWSCCLFAAGKFAERGVIVVLTEWFWKFDVWLKLVVLFVCEPLWPVPWTDSWFPITIALASVLFGLIKVWPRIFTTALGGDAVDGNKGDWKDNVTLLEFSFINLESGYELLFSMFLLSPFRALLWLCIVGFVQVSFKYRNLHALRIRTVNSIAFLYDAGPYSILMWLV